jgi:hypothetical protein
MKLFQNSYHQVHQTIKVIMEKDKKVEDVEREEVLESQKEEPPV